MKTAPLTKVSQSGGRGGHTRRLSVGLYMSCLGLWMGASVFYALVVLPALFSSLERTAAGDIAALLFPPFYALCLACGGGVLAASLSLAIGAGGRWRVAAAAVVIMLACQGWAALALQPKMAELRSVWRHHPAPTRKSEEGRKPKASLETTARREFARLHVRSVALNGVAITLGLGLMGASGYFLGNKND